MRVDALDREWVIPTEPSVDVLLKFRDWIAEELGDIYEPVELAIKYGLPEAERVALFKECRALKEELRCLAPGTPLFRRFCESAVGGLKFLELQLRERYPDITPREVMAVTMAYAEKLEAEARARGNGQTPAPSQTAAVPG